VCLVHLCNFGWLVKKAQMLLHPIHLTCVTVAIYAATTVVKAETRRMEFDEKWGKDYHSIVLSW